jgi:DNA-binding transcriptional regulator YiaG
MKCANCGEPLLTKAFEKHRIDVAKTLFVGRLPVLRCDGCGEWIVLAGAVDAFERRIASHLAQYGPATGETFRFMRKAIGAPARSVAELLHTTPETISRWEKGARPVDTCAWTTLATLVLDEISGSHAVRDRLQALRTELPARREEVEFDLTAAP